MKAAGQTLQNNTNVNIGMYTNININEITRRKYMAKKSKVKGRRG